MKLTIFSFFILFFLLKKRLNAENITVDYTDYYFENAQQCTLIQGDANKVAIFALLKYRIF